MTNPIAAVVGLGAIAALRAPSIRGAVGVPVEPYITDAHRAAMAALSHPVLNASGPEGTAATQALHRYNEVMRTMLAFAGFKVIGARSYPTLSADQWQKVFDWQLAAVRAGVNVVGSTYKLTNLVTGFEGGATALLEGEPLIGPAAWAPLTALGASASAAAKARNALAFHPSIVPVDQVKMHGIASTLATNMDDVGFLIAGKPPPDPSVAGGIAYAGYKTGAFVAGLAGDAAGALASKLVGNPWLWMAGIGFVAWRVLR